MKSTILLTTALFLASAPALDSKTLTELSAGFLSVKNDYALMASETTSDMHSDTWGSTPAQSRVSATAEDIEKIITQAEQINSSGKYASASTEIPGDLYRHIQPLYLSVADFRPQ